MKGATYTKMMTEAPFGAAYHKIILDDNGKPVDYVFLEVNRAFERLTGLKAKDILNTGSGIAMATTTGCLTGKKF